MSLGSFQKNIKVLVLVVISIAIFAGTVFFGKNAADYFAKASSCPVKNVRAEKVAANSGSVNWETDENTQGKVDYGTNPQSLTFSSPEASTAKNHSVPLTLLTPNTIYYYLISVGETKCDSSGQKCEEGSCTPYSFTTTTLSGVNEEANTSGTPAVSKRVEPTGQTATPTVTFTANPTSTSTLFCRAVEANIGKNSKVATEWATLKTYDIDGNGIINGIDVIKCQQSGK